MAFLTRLAIFAAAIRFTTAQLDDETCETEGGDCEFECGKNRASDGTEECGKSCCVIFDDAFKAFDDGSSPVFDGIAQCNAVFDVVVARCPFCQEACAIELEDRLYSVTDGLLGVRRWSALGAAPVAFFAASMLAVIAGGVVAFRRWGAARAPATVRAIEQGPQSKREEAALINDAQNMSDLPVDQSEAA